jgi:hypothetical protein
VKGTFVLLSDFAENPIILEGDKTMKKTLAVVFFLAAALPAHGQTTSTSNTDCTVYGNTASCRTTTTSTETTAADVERQKELNKAGEELGTALGAGIGRGIEAAKRHNAKKRQEKFDREQEREFEAARARVQAANAARPETERAKSGAQLQERFDAQLQAARAKVAADAAHPNDWRKDFCPAHRDAFSCQSYPGSAKQ